MEEAVQRGEWRIKVIIKNHLQEDVLVSQLFLVNCQVDIECECECESERSVLRSDESLAFFLVCRFQVHREKLPEDFHCNLFFNWCITDIDSFPPQTTLIASLSSPKFNERILTSDETSQSVFNSNSLHALLVQFLFIHSYFHSKTHSVKNSCSLLKIHMFALLMQIIWKRLFSKSCNLNSI